MALRSPLLLVGELSNGALTLTPYRSTDAEELFLALRGPRVWEHIPRPVPTSPAELHAQIQDKLADGTRMTLTIRQDTRVVGTTSLIFDPGDPEGIEIGATQLSEDVWGSGVNGAAKQLLLDAVFRAGARWVRFRTDERNIRSAAAIHKLGATELGVREDSLVRRDGTRRRSVFFRLAPPSD